MIQFQTHEEKNRVTYRTADPYFQRLYIDSNHHAIHSEQSQETVGWDPLSYVPLCSSSYNIPGQDPLDELVSHRSAVLNSQVEGIMQQLYERQKIHEHAIKSIDYDTVKCDSEILQLKQLMCWNAFNPLSELSKKQQNLEKEVMGLERQRRDEYASLWKDKVLLRKELVELAGAHAGAKARESILGEVTEYGI